MEEWTCENCKHHHCDGEGHYCSIEEYAMQGFNGKRCDWWERKDDEEVVIEE